MGAVHLSWSRDSTFNGMGNEMTLRLRGKLIQTRPSDKWWHDWRPSKNIDGEIELPPLSRSPKVGDEVLVKVIWCETAQHLVNVGAFPGWKGFVAILPSEEKECMCLSLTNQKTEINEPDCPIHSNKAEEKKSFTEWAKENISENLGNYGKREVKMEWKVWCPHIQWSNKAGDNYWGWWEGAVPLNTDTFYCRLCGAKRPDATEKVGLPEKLFGWWGKVEPKEIILRYNQLIDYLRSKEERR